VLVAYRRDDRVVHLGELGLGPSITLYGARPVNIRRHRASPPSRRAMAFATTSDVKP
jgi:hypothetical protein